MCSTYVRGLLGPMSMLFLFTFAILVGRPFEGIMLVALWTAVCFAVHLVQVVQAALAKVSKRPITSWLTEESAAD